MDLDPKIISILKTVRQPARYIGGETGSVLKNETDYDFRVGIAFPDLYEIGMSNQAVRILYERMNRLPRVYCERLFAPAPDFKAAIAAAGIPLFTLESNRPVRDCNLLCFSVGSELALTTLIGILDAAQIPVFADQRGEGDPIVLCGGPATTNPAPFAPFADAVYIGEFETGGDELITALADANRNGATREEQLRRLPQFPFLWIKGVASAAHPARRSVLQKLCLDRDCNSLPLIPYFAVQNHGVVEIMRGCPNNCRFCHAGTYYHPAREKSLSDIYDEADYLVRRGGYQTITLSSLSSGDVTNLLPITRLLNERFKNQRVTLSLPSLRISSFSLNILEGLNRGEAKKSGLTFAVETPCREWQQSLNKTVPLDKTLAILQEALRRGWQSAKFYFMIGLPTSLHTDEVSEIIRWIRTVKEALPIRIHVTVGTFVPKPHTPFQWAPQADPDAAWEQLARLKSELSAMKVKVNYMSPYHSRYEGLLSRGDESMGLAAYEAYRNGAYLDLWDETFNEAAWEKGCKQMNPKLLSAMKTGFPLEASLPWEGVSLGCSTAFLKREWKRALKGEASGNCGTPCSLHCGVCSKNCHPVREAFADETDETYQRLWARAVESSKAAQPPLRSRKWKLCLAYCKQGRSRWIAHRDLIEVFARMWITAPYFLHYSEGFHPKPKQEFASPLPVAFQGEEEWTSIEILLDAETDPTDSAFKASFLDTVNRLAVDGVMFRQLYAFPVENQCKKFKMMPLVSALEYEIRPQTGNEASPFGSEANQIAFVQRVGGWDLNRRAVLTKGEGKQEGLLRFKVASTQPNPQKGITAEEAQHFDVVRIALWSSRFSFLKGDSRGGESTSKETTPFPDLRPKEDRTQPLLQPFSEAMPRWEEEAKACVNGLKYSNL